MPNRTTADLQVGDLVSGEFRNRIVLSKIPQPDGSFMVGLSIDAGSMIAGPTVASQPGRSWWVVPTVNIDRSAPVIADSVINPWGDD